MKATYLSLVFASPLLAFLLPFNWLQVLWVPAYVPFAIVFGVLAYFRPRSEMFGWIAACPIVFWLVINVLVPIYLMGDGGFEAWVNSALAVLIVSTPIGFLVGAYCFLFAAVTFAAFRSRGWFA